MKADFSDSIFFNSILYQEEIEAPCIVHEYAGDTTCLHSGEQQRQVTAVYFAPAKPSLLRQPPVGSFPILQDPSSFRRRSEGRPSHNRSDSAYLPPLS